MLNLWMMEVLIRAMAAVVAGGTIGLLARWRRWRVDRVELWGAFGFAGLIGLIGYVRLSLNILDPVHLLSASGYRGIARLASILLAWFFLLAGGSHGRFADLKSGCPLRVRKSFWAADERR